MTSYIHIDIFEETRKRLWFPVFSDMFITLVLQPNQNILLLNVPPA